MAAADQKAQEREVGVRQVAVGQVDEVREDMPLQVVDLDHGYVAGYRQPLGERHAHQKRAEQAGTARKGYRVDLVGRDAGLLQGRVDHGYDVLLVCARGQLGYHAAVLDVYRLRGDDVREQRAVADNGGRSIVARGFDAQYGNVHFYAYFSV